MRGLGAFVRTAGIYFVGQVSVKILSVLLLPVYTAFLTPADYGYFDVSVVVLSLATAVIYAEVASALLRFGLDPNSEARPHAVPTVAFLSALVSSVFYLALGVVVGFWWAPHLWPAALAFGLSSALCTFYQSLARAYLRNVAFMVSGIANSLVTAVCNIVFLVGLHWGGVSLFAAGFLGNLVQIAIFEGSVGGVRRVRLSSWDRSLFRRMLRFSVPLVANSIFLWCSTGLLRIIVANRLGVAANGYIAVADRFLVGMSIFSSIAALAWQEAAYLASGDPRRAERYSAAMDLYLRALGGGLSVMLPITYLLFPYLVAPSYWEAKTILPLYFVTVVLNALGVFLGTIFTAELRSLPLLYSTGLNAAVSVSVLLACLPSLGIHAFVLASLLGAAGMLVTRYAVCRRAIMKVSFDYRLLTLLIGEYVCAVVIFFHGDVRANALALVVSLGLLVYLLRELLARVGSVIVNRRT